MLRSWLMSVWHLLGELANPLTTLVVLTGLLVTRPSWLWWSLFLARLRVIRAVPVDKTGMRPRLRRLTMQYERAKEITRGYGVTAAEEVEWICRLLDPVSGHTLPDLLPRGSIRNLSGAYARHAGRLHGRILLGTSVPSVAQAHTVADQTSRYLSLLAGQRTDSVQKLDPDPRRAVSSRHLELHQHERGCSFRLFAFPGNPAGHFAFDLVTSYRRHVLAPLLPYWKSQRGDGFTQEELPSNESERAALKDQLVTGHLFDGVLPRLLGAEVLRDAGSGRTRLALNLSACSYSAVILDHYPGSDQVGRTRAGMSTVTEHPRPRGVSSVEVDGSRVGLLTLGLGLVTRDDYLVFTLRSASAGSHEGMYGASVTGNLELAHRYGVPVDLDEYGVPDPIAALCRETREELGLRLQRDDVFVTGLCQFTGPTEVNTNMLIATAHTSQTLAEIAGGCVNADIIEGRWEVGSSLLGMRLPRTPEGDLDRAGLTERLRWLMKSPRLSPQATAVGLISLAAVLGNADLFARCNDLDGEAPDPACCDWLTSVPTR